MIPFLLGAKELLGKRSTWITLLVTLGVFLAGFALMNYVAVKSENMALTAELSETKDDLDQMRDNVKANTKALATRNELITALAKVEVGKRAETIKALEANPDWANQPIPSDVLDSLRD